MHLLLVSKEAYFAAMSAIGCAVHHCLASTADLATPQSDHALGVMQRLKLVLLLCVLGASSGFAPGLHQNHDVYVAAAVSCSPQLLR